MSLSSKLVVFVALAGCAEDILPDPMTTPDESTPVDSETTEPAEPVDSRIRSLSFGMRFGIAADGLTIGAVTDASGTVRPSQVWFVLANQDGDRCSITVAIDGLQLEILAGENQAYAFQVSATDPVVTDCTPESHDTSWFPGGDALSHVPHWRFEWGGPLNPAIFDWTEIVDGEEYYLGAKVAGPLMSAPEKDVVFVRGYEVDGDLSMAPTGSRPIPADELVVDDLAVSAAYEFVVPWSVIYNAP